MIRRDSLLRGQTGFAAKSRANWLLILGAAVAFSASAQLPADLPSVTPANYAAANTVQDVAVSNNLPATASTAATNDFKASLAMAHYFEALRQPEKAEPILIGLLAGNIPDSIHKTALLELGATVRAENDLPRAQTIYAQFLKRWPNDVQVPEILLRQGEIFRQMGLNDMALGKFYSVMTAALSLKSDQLPYYESLVLQTQVEIADTHYLTGEFGEAADFYSRLLQKSEPGLNRPQMQFRLIRSLAILGRNDETVGQAQDFLSRFADSEETPEVRYYLAESLKALGRNNEALQQVLLCLREQKNKTKNDPEVWAYWQQRVGNEIANQLYHEGDYVRALEVYINLAQLDSSPAWQVPVEYQ